MFRSIWSKTLRDYRIATLGWGIGLGFLFFVLFAVFASQYKDASQIATLTQLAQQFSFFGDPVGTDTLPGFVTWRGLALVTPILLSIWALLAGARLIRGEEERNSLDILLSTPQSRVRLFIEKIAALIVAVVVICLLLTLGGIAGEARTNTPVDVGRVLFASLNLGLLAFFFAMLALFLSQLLHDRGAASGWTGGLLVLSVLLDSSGRTIDNGTWLRILSPFYYYGANKPLVTSYSTNFGAAALLLGVSLLLAAISIYLFAIRDIGRTAFSAWEHGSVSTSKTTKQPADVNRRAIERAERDAFERSVGLRALRAQAPLAFCWLLGIILLATWLTLLTPSLEAPLKKILSALPFAGRLTDVLNTGLLDAILFTFLPLLVVIFILGQALSWANDLDSGRLELVLSTPKSRPRVILERFAAVLIPALIAPLLIWLSVLVGAAISNLSINVGNVAAASLGLLPLELIVATFVYLLAGRLSSSTIMGIATLLIALSFLLELLKSALNLPDWVLSLSIFHDYGTPLKDGLQWGPLTAMLGIAIVFLAIGVAQFTQSDLERGS